VRDIVIVNRVDFGEVSALGWAESDVFRHVLELKLSRR
jgi:hypothetical protein